MPMNTLVGVVIVVAGWVFAAFAVKTVLARKDIDTTQETSLTLHNSTQQVAINRQPAASRVING